MLSLSDLCPCCNNCLANIFQLQSIRNIHLLLFVHLLPQSALVFTVNVNRTVMTTFTRTKYSPQYDSKYQHRDGGSYPKAWLQGFDGV